MDQEHEPDQGQFKGTDTPVVTPAPALNQTSVTSNTTAGSAHARISVETSNASTAIEIDLTCPDIGTSSTTYNFQKGTSFDTDRCERCILQRRKCDGKKPICGLCENLNTARRDCTYPEGRPSRSQLMRKMEEDQKNQKPKQNPATEPPKARQTPVPGRRTNATRTPVSRPRNARQPAPKKQKKAPQDANPQVANPQVARPQVTNPRVANPQLANPQIARPQVPNPQLANPQIARPQAPNPQVANPQVVSPYHFNTPQFGDPLSGSRYNPMFAPANFFDPTFTLPLSSRQIPRAQLGNLPPVGSFQYGNPNFVNPHVTHPQAGSRQFGSYQVARPQFGNLQTSNPQAAPPLGTSPHFANPQVLNDRPQQSYTPSVNPRKRSHEQLTETEDSEEEEKETDDDETEDEAEDQSFRLYSNAELEALGPPIDPLTGQIYPIADLHADIDRFLAEQAPAGGGPYAGFQEHQQQQASESGNVLQDIEGAASLAGPSTSTPPSVSAPNADIVDATGLYAGLDLNDPWTIFHRDDEITAETGSISPVGSEPFKEREQVPAQQAAEQPAEALAEEPSDDQPFEEDHFLRDAFPEQFEQWDLEKELEEIRRAASEDDE